jgi:hypothetical protein
MVDVKIRERFRLAALGADLRAILLIAIASIEACMAAAGAARFASVAPTCYRRLLEVE